MRVSEQCLCTLHTAHSTGVLGTLATALQSVTTDIWDTARYRSYYVVTCQLLLGFGSYLTENIAPVKFYTNLRVTSRVFFSIWTKVVVFRKVLVAVPNVNCKKGCPVETTLFHAGRQTDMTQPIFAFYQCFPNAAKTLLNVKFCEILSTICV